MILILCLPCAFAMRVNGDPEEILPLVGPRSEYWPNKFTCPRCEKPAEGQLEAHVGGPALSRMEVVDLTAQEAIAAMHGLGLPVERACTIEEVQELLSEKKFKVARGTNIRGTTRCILDHLVLEDGTRIYLGASAEGATVYRITRPHSYVESLG